MKRIKQLLVRFVRFVDTRRAYRFYIKDWTSLDELHLASQVVNSMRFTRQINPVELDFPKGRSVVVIAPHPDDEVIGPGGTLIKAAIAGAKITIVYLTSGPEKLVETLEKEARLAAEDIQAGTEFLRWPVNDIPDTDESIRSLSKKIACHQPDTIMVSFCLDDHDDHRRASDLLMRIADAKLLNPDIEIWAYQVYSAVLPNVVVDITEVAERKKNNVAVYQSQYVSRNWGHFALGLNAWNCRFLKGRGSKLSYAELFLVLPLDAYSDICRKYFVSSDKTYYTARYTDDSRYEAKG